MNRVWKKFFKKVGKGLAVLTYMFSVLVIPGFISMYFGYLPELGTMLGGLFFIVLPMVSYILRDTYRESKYEVDRENREMLRTIKGNDY